MIIQKMGPFTWCDQGPREGMWQVRTVLYLTDGERDVVGGGGPARGGLALVAGGFACTETDDMDMEVTGISGASPVVQGRTAKDNRESQAVFLCVSCGHSDHADANAARNVLARGLALTGVSAQAPGPWGVRPRQPAEAAAGTTRSAA